MPYSGGGVFTLTPGYTATTGQTILPSQHNPPLEDIAAGLNLAFLRDGRSAATGNWNMGANRITNLADAVDPGDVVNNGQISTIAGFRNVLRNGSFIVNQRGVSGSVVLAAGAYGHDGWKAGASGCTYTFSTVNGIVVVSISAGTLLQIVEASSFIGRTGNYLLSWSGTAQGRINGGSYGSSGGVFASITPSANATVEFSTGTLSLAQFELGTVTRFANRSAQEEISLSQRFYEKGQAQLYLAGFSGNISVNQQFSVLKRSQPSIVLSAPSAGGTSVPGLQETRADGFRIAPGGSGEVNFSWAASAEL